jgi:hypothetical protein
VLSAETSTWLEPYFRRAYGKQNDSTQWFFTLSRCLHQRSITASCFGARLAHRHIGFTDCEESGSQRRPISTRVIQKPGAHPEEGMNKGNIEGLFLPKAAMMLNSGGQRCLLKDIEE